MKNWPPLEALKRLFANYFLAILLSAVVALLVRFYVVEAFLIPTDFMVPTLLPGDHIFVNKLKFEPKRGDVIVFTFPNDPRREYIKRVIAVGGDEVEIREGHLWLNGKDITSKDFEETAGDLKYYVSWEGAPMENRRMISVKVPPGKIFVLGDNRAKGQDSRTWGFLPSEYVRGKAWTIWFSVARPEESPSLAKRVRWERMLKRVL